MRVLHPRGFTLIEMLVVVLLVSIMFALVGVNLSQDETSQVRDEANRLALVLQAVQQEAILQSQIIVLVVSAAGYEFMQPDNEGKLVALSGDDVLTAHAWKNNVSLHSVEIEGLDDEEKITGILFEPSGSQPAFTITLAAGDIRWHVKGHANGKIVSLAPLPAKAAYAS